MEAAEALRHAIGSASGASNGEKTVLLLYDGGVFAAKKGQKTEEAGFEDLEAAMRNAIRLGIDVIAERMSLGEQKMGEEELIEGAKVMDGYELAGIIAEARASFIF